MYQNEASDGIVSPAHALLIPQDGSRVANFLNFKDLGVNTLRESSAFAKIRNFTKIYSTNLVQNDSDFTAKYRQLSNLYLNENNFLESHSFGVSKQCNFSSTLSLGNGSASVMLDLQSFKRFLNSTTDENTKFWGKITCHREIVKLGESIVRQTEFGDIIGGEKGKRDTDNKKEKTS